MRQAASLLQRFLRLQASGGILLMLAALVALVFANVPGLSSLYRSLLSIPIEVTLGPLVLDKNFLLVVNDGFMAIFFLLVALEIKREILEGELSDLRQVVMPLVAAVGGVLVPALIYTGFTQGDPIGRTGWAIPAATDIAFSLGVLSLLGSRVPLALKVFLTAVAVIDDLGAILIIALFYTEKLSFTALAWAMGGLLVLLVLNRFRVTRLAAYFIVGTIMWVSVLKSGVHATLAGVALGFAIPLRTANPDAPSPLKHLEHMLHPWVAFMILPLFAFVNSGVSFGGIGTDVLFGPVTLGVAAGLVFGKTIGVFGFSALAVGVRVARLPRGVTWPMLFGVSLLTGIGFTMSLFIGMLAFEGAGDAYAVATRLGVFGGSIAAALLGAGMLRIALRSAPRQPAPGEPASPGASPTGTA